MTTTNVLVPRIYQQRMKTDLVPNNQNNHDKCRRHRPVVSCWMLPLLLFIYNNGISSDNHRPHMFGWCLNHNSYNNNYNKRITTANAIRIIPVTTTTSMQTSRRRSHLFLSPSLSSLFGILPTTATTTTATVSTLQLQNDEPNTSDNSAEEYEEVELLSSSASSTNDIDNSNNISKNYDESRSSSAAATTNSSSDMLDDTITLTATTSSNDQIATSEVPPPPPSISEQIVTTPNRIIPRKRNKVAMIFNVNARSVSKDIIQAAQLAFEEANAANANNTNAMYGTVFVTSNEVDAQNVARSIVADLDEYALIVPVGGDGTLSTIIQLLCQEIQHVHQYTNIEDAIQQLPDLSYLPMGTGNGLGNVVGCLLPPSTLRLKLIKLIPPGKARRARRMKKIVNRLLQATEERYVNEECDNHYDQQEEPLNNIVYSTTTAAVVDIINKSYEILEVPMIHAKAYPTAPTTNHTTNHQNNNNYLCFFAGVGFDSLMLNDYKHIKEWSQKNTGGFIRTTLSSVLGYCVALVVRTLPSAIFHGKHQIYCTVRSNYYQDHDCWWVDHRRGDFVFPVIGSSGTTSGSTAPSNTNNNNDIILYNGTMGILAAGTSPFYGGGLRLFPFARMTPDKMHVRIGRIHPATGFFNIARIFEGSYRDTSLDQFGCLDFIGTNFDVTILSSINKNVTATSPSTESTTAVSGTQQPQQQPQQPQQGYPFQHSGESIGLVNRFQLQVTKHKIRFLCLSPRRPKTG